MVKGKLDSFQGPLKRLLAADTRSAVIDVVALGQEAGMGVRAATEAVEAWVKAGAGVYDEGRWRMESAEQVIKLVDALSVLAEA